MPLCAWGEGGRLLLAEGSVVGKAQTFKCEAEPGFKEKQKENKGVISHRSSFNFTFIHANVGGRLLFSTFNHFTKLC